MPDDTKIYNELYRLRHDAQTLGIYEIHELDAKSWVTNCLRDLNDIVCNTYARRKPRVKITCDATEALSGFERVISHGKSLHHELTDRKNAVNRIIDSMHAAREKRAEEFDRILLSKFKEGAVVPVGSDVVTVTNRKQAEELFGVGSGLADLFKPAPLTYQNSCKVDKVEHGELTAPPQFYPGPDNWYFYKGTPYSSYDRNPTRKVETDNTTGKANDKCNPSGHDVTKVYIRGLGDVAYYNPGPTTNVNWCLPNGSIPNRFCGMTANKPAYNPPSGIAREGHIAVGVWVNYMPPREIRNAKCLNIDTAFEGEDGGMGAPPLKARPIGVALNSAREGQMVLVAINNNATGMISKKLIANQVIYTAQVVTTDMIKPGPVERVPCDGCSFAKWPNAGPGYGERCDKCKLSSARPDYEPKVNK